MKALFILSIFAIALTGCIWEENHHNDDNSYDDQPGYNTNYDATNPYDECGVTNCHGMDISCGEVIEPFACTEIYEIGDKCRQYVNCEIIEGQCAPVETREFLECKTCVQECITSFPDGGSGLFECESRC